MVFKLSNLSYVHNTLELCVDQKTMGSHHNRRHSMRVAELSATVEGAESERQSLADMIANLDKISEAIGMSVHSNGNGHFNHSSFWEILSPSSEEKGNVMDDTKAQWGTLDEFRSEFANKTTTLFESGWAWLVVNDGKLEIAIVPDQDSPLTEGETPILLFDVWKHTYYLKYRSKRPDYMAASWGIVNRKEVSKLYQAAK